MLKSFFTYKPKLYQLWFFVLATFFFAFYAFASTFDYYDMLEREAVYQKQIDRLERSVEKQRGELINLKRRRAEIKKPEEKALALANNNPLNIKTVKGGWQGQIAIDKYGHAVFEDVAYGLRAAANVLMKYYTVHKIDTLNGIIERFCQANKKEYVKFLAKRLNIRPNQKFDVMGRLPELLQAMARFESGAEWDNRHFAAYSLMAFK